MNWRPKDWKNPYIQIASDFWDDTATFKEAVTTSQVFETGADAMLQRLKPLLTTIHAQLCGVRMEHGKTPWYSALDKSIDDISQILGKVNQ